MSNYGTTELRRFIRSTLGLSSREFSVNHGTCVLVGDRARKAAEHADEFVAAEYNIRVQYFPNGAASAIIAPKTSATASKSIRTEQDYEDLQQSVRRARVESAMEEGGYRIHWSGKNRKTGLPIEIIDNRDEKFDEGGQPWITFCSEHGNYCEHETQKLAGLHYAHPEGWCADCEEMLDPRYVLSGPDAENGGTFTVETPSGEIVAGPYASENDAQEAKVALLEGRSPRSAG